MHLLNMYIVSNENVGILCHVKGMCALLGKNEKGTVWRL